MQRALWRFCIVLAFCGFLQFGLPRFGLLFGLAYSLKLYLCFFIAT